jgi:hypothetical protein
VTQWLFTSRVFNRSGARAATRREVEFLNF